MNLNLIMAVVWFVVGAGLLVVTYTMGDDALPFRVRFLPISPGWLALLLCVYNVVRWRSGPRRRQDPLAAALAARRRMRRDRDDPPPAPDPTFDFTAAPPPDPDPPRTGPPPSAN